MAERVLLHVGMQKTGTTYLQAALVAGGQTLRSAGLVYPRPRAGSLLSHQLAFYGLVGPEIPHVSPRQGQELRAQWDWLAEQVRDSQGSVLLSCESLSFIRTQAAQTILDTLHQLGVDDVEVVITGRDVGRLLVSGWQQHIRNGRVASLEEFLTARARDRQLAEQDSADVERVSIWRAYSVAGVAARWARLLSPQRVHVVTTRPGAPSHVLWDRFLTAMGVPEVIGLPAPQVPADRANIGMRWPEADVMAAVNAALVDAGWPEGRGRELRAHVINHGFLPRQERGTAIAIPTPWRARVAEWGQVELGQLHTLVEQGLAVHGDLEDLRSNASPSDGQDASVAAVGTAQTRPYPEEELMAAVGAAVVAAASYVSPDDLPAAMRKATGQAVRQTRQTMSRRSTDGAPRVSTARPGSVDGQSGDRAAHADGQTTARRPASTASSTATPGPWGGLVGAARRFARSVSRRSG